MTTKLTAEEEHAKQLALETTATGTQIPARGKTIIFKATHESGTRAVYALPISDDGVDSRAVVKFYCERWNLTNGTFEYVVFP